MNERPSIPSSSAQARNRRAPILHGGLSLHAAGALRARDAEALVDFLTSLIEEP